MRLFRRPPPLRDAITDALRELQAEKNRLQFLSARIQQRDRLLFDLCVTATKNRNTEKASILANELSELRKAANMVYKSQLLVEQFILRLETIRELGDILSQLKPAIDIMSDIKRQISGIMPDVAEKLDDINSELGNAIAMMHQTTDLSEAKSSFLTSSELAEKVLNEATEIVEERIKEELPEPRPNLVPEKEPIEEARMEAVALAAGGSKVETEVIPTDIKAEGLPLLEPVKVNLILLTREDELKEKVFAYAKRNRGEIHLRRCAEELNIDCKEVLETLDLLHKENKIKY